MKKLFYVGLVLVCITLTVGLLSRCDHDDTTEFVIADVSEITFEELLSPPYVTPDAWSFANSWWLECGGKNLDPTRAEEKLYLEIEEVNKITPVKEQSVGEKIVTGFTENLYDVGEGLLDFFIWFVTHIPSLVVWAVVIFIILLVIKGIKKCKQKKQLKKQSEGQPDACQKRKWRKLGRKQAETTEKPAATPETVNENIKNQ